MTELLPTDQPIFWQIAGTAAGMTRIGELTGVSENLVVVYGEGEQEYMNAVANSDIAPPQLPNSGHLETGEIYTWNNQIVMVRQSHERTVYSPDQTPALFLIYRLDGLGIDWIAGEQVYVGTERTFDGILYRALQAHVTQADWTPPTVPALWRIVTQPTNEWQPNTFYTIGDEVTYAGILYQCRQSHTSIVGWEPPNVLALWLPI